MLLATILCVGIAAFGILVFENLSFMGTNLLGAAWGAAAFPIYAISVAHANDYAEADEYVMVSSGLLLMFGSGAIVGPFIASAVMTFTSSAGMYAFTAIAHTLLALHLVLRLASKNSAPVGQHIEFRDALTTAVTASQVYEEEIQYSADDNSADDD